MLMESSKFQKKGGEPGVGQDFRDEAESCRIVLAAPEPVGGVSVLADLDRLDRLALALLLVLLLSALGLMVFQPGEVKQPERKVGSGRQNVAVASPEFANQMAAAATLLQGGDPARAGQLLDALIAKYPYEGGPHMLKGDLLLREQQAIGAMLEFRQGVDLNPDYLDKKMTEVFQGKKVKNTLEEARLVIAAGLARTPGDATLRQQREVLYYMLRKVAGSCG